MDRFMMSEISPVIRINDKETLKKITALTLLNIKLPRKKPIIAAGAKEKLVMTLGYVAIPVIT